MVYYPAKTLVQERDPNSELSNIRVGAISKTIDRAVHGLLIVVRGRLAEVPNSVTEVKFYYGHPYNDPASHYHSFDITNNISTTNRGNKALIVQG